ncbi:hypothetical protein EG328_007600 [Venturia inaequalis]|uniref:Uncharacterized protein n=1 Tax=Venturia inaequalis TaxID=5025 RepID=A0A8H3Z9I5_VENIN|nr:hypothetical protein EG328_007600 [Venturia inaequalis]RDI86473.1 hypothetical protein Vi05172_g3518 [Venturia inaequalis]
MQRTPKSIYITSSLDVALDAAQELHRVQESKKVTLRQPSNTNQSDHEAVFLTMFNRAIQWEKDIPNEYRSNPIWLDSYRRGRHDGLRAFMLRRFPYLFEKEGGDEIFEGMWKFCIKACKGSVANQEDVKSDLEAMMRKMSLGTENMEGLMAGIDWGSLGSHVVKSEMDIN